MKYVDAIEKSEMRSPLKKWDSLFWHNKSLHFIEPEARP